MLIAHHLIYYALFLVVLDIARCVHPLFLIGLIPYTFFMVWRTNKWSLLIAGILTIILLRPIAAPRLSSTLSGRVKTISSNHIVVKTSYGKVKVYTDRKFHYNDAITFKAKPLTIRKAANDNGFDEQRYLKGAHIIAKVYMTSLISRHSHFSLANVIEDHLSRDKKLKSYQRLFILGLKDEEIREDYQTMTSLSIVHMFALSGMHVVILYRLFTALYGLLLEKKKAQLCAKASIGFYVFSIPFNISLQRAFLMLVLSDLLASRFNRYDVLSMLVIGHLLYNPYVIFSISFVFSYVIYSIVLLTQNQKHSDVIIYMGSLPIVMSLNYSINLISFLLADILIPFVEVFYVFTVGSVIFPVLKPIIMFLIIIFGKMMRLTNDLSQSITFQKPNLLFLGIYYYAYAHILYHQFDYQCAKRYVLMLASVLIAFHIYSTYKIYSEVGMINVGQGDCSYIRLPFNQGNILIDTGGSRSYDVATSTVIPFLKSKGIDHLDYVYISHSDYDHSGALDSLQQHFNVKKVITSHQQPKKIGPLTIQFLTNKKTYDNANDNSQMQLMKLNGYTYFFTGDISQTAEKDLYKQYKKLHIDVLKVAHHGSRYSSSVTFFEMVHPKIAMIGVGENNRYGHPNDQVIKRLEERGIYILRTDRDGNFCIRDYGSDHYIYK